MVCQVAAHQVFPKLECNYVGMMLIAEQAMGPGIECPGLLHHAQLCGEHCCCPLDLITIQALAQQHCQCKQHVHIQYVMLAICMPRADSAILGLLIVHDSGSDLAVICIHCHLPAGPLGGSCQRSQQDRQTSTGSGITDASSPGYCLWLSSRLDIQNAPQVCKLAEQLHQGPSSITDRQSGDARL